MCARACRRDGTDRYGSMRMYVRTCMQAQLHAAGVHTAWAAGCDRGWGVCVAIGQAHTGGQELAWQTSYSRPETPQSQGGGAHRRGLPRRQVAELMAVQAGFTHFTSTPKTLNPKPSGPPPWPAAAAGGQADGGSELQPRGRGVHAQAGAAAGQHRRPGPGTGGCVWVCVWGGGCRGGRHPPKAPLCTACMQGLSGRVGTGVGWGVGTEGGSCTTWCRACAPPQREGAAKPCQHPNPCAVAACTRNPRTRPNTPANTRSTPARNNPGPSPSWLAVGAARPDGQAVVG